jgi:protein-disulfide isomerase
MNFRMSKLKPPVSINDQLTGNPSSSITLVEFGDYQCPHCGHAHPLVKKLIKEKGESFLFVFRNFPLREVHPAAFMAALSAEAAGRQGKFWKMHDIIFENQQHLHGNSFLDFSSHLQLDSLQFAKDLEDNNIKEKVDADFESGIRSGVNGTPAFFINGEMFYYDTTYESLLKAIEKNL